MEPFELHPAILELANAASAGVRARPAEIRMAKEALVAERQRFRELFDFAPDGYLVTDRHGTILDANLMASELLGVSRDFLLGKPFSIYMPLSERRRFRTLLNQLKTSHGTPQNFQTVLNPRGGPPFDAEIRVAGGVELRWMLRDVTAQRALEARYRSLCDHLQRRIEEERTRIARDVHDEIGAALTAIRIELSLAARDARKGNGSSPLPHLEAIVRVDAAIQSIKRLCADLRPSLLDHLGLWAAIEWLAEDFAARSGLRCTTDLDPEAEVRDPQRSTALYRIVQEALTNVQRHARATEVRIVARKNADETRLEVSDDGRGIAEAELARTDAFGLIGMQERAFACGGSVMFERPGRGTRVVVQLPGASGCGS